MYLKLWMNSRGGNGVPCFDRIQTYVGVRYVTRKGGVRMPNVSWQGTRRNLNEKKMEQPEPVKGGAW